MTDMKAGPWRRPGNCDTGACVEVRRCDTGNCVEVSEGANVVQVRQSEHPETVLTFTRDEWDSFLTAVRAREF